MRDKTLSLVENSKEVLVTGTSFKMKFQYEEQTGRFEAECSATDSNRIRVWNSIKQAFPNKNLYLRLRYR